MPSEPSLLPMVTPPSRDGTSPDAAEVAATEGAGAAAADPPSEALRILAGPETVHRNALVDALEEARGALRSLRSTGGGRAARVALELGPMAGGPLDPERFTALLEREAGMDPGLLEHFERAVSILEWATEKGGRASEVTVAGGESLAQAVDRALRNRGRAFGAVRTLALLRTGEFRAEEHGSLLEGLPFQDWRTVERQVAPPLVVEVPGSRMDTAGALAPVLDGNLKILLLVRGPAPPAPLARLIVPGVLVIQTDDPAALVRLGEFRGPAVGALMPEPAAAFVHDPDGGEAGAAAPGLRLVRLPESPPRGWSGGASPAQQLRDLELLRAWSRIPDPLRTAASGLPEPSEEEEQDDAPAERLAAWLLRQAELETPDQD